MNNTAEIQTPSEHHSAASQSQEKTSAATSKPQKGSNSTVASSKRKLESAIEAAEAHLKEVKDWIAAHQGSAVNSVKKPHAISSQMQSKLEKVATAQSELSRAQTKATTTTVASMISAIGPNVDLQSVDEMLKGGKDPREVIAHLNTLLLEAVDG